MTYESKRIKEIVERMQEATDIHALNQLYNEAGKELFLVYDAVLMRIFNKSKVEGSRL